MPRGVARQRSDNTRARPRRRGSARGVVEVTGKIDRLTAEALYLEVRRLAKRYGLDVGALRLRRRGDSA